MSLEQMHRIIISMRTLKRITKRCGLYRHKYHSDILQVVAFIASHCESYGQMHGYRWMHYKCLKNSLVVSQETLRTVMHILDPEGIANRKAHKLQRRKYVNPGPNFVWHIDGYDKPSRYGICIHGCVDGFSRNIIWLKAYHTNRNPRIIASIQAFNLCSRRVRADRGTENGHVEQMQMFLRRNHEDLYTQDKRFIYGTSTHNQRTESIWGIVRRQGIQYWMNLFQKLTDNGQFDGGFLDKELARFCSMDMVQVNELKMKLSLKCIFKQYKSEQFIFSLLISLPLYLDICC